MVPFLIGNRVPKAPRFRENCFCAGFIGGDFAPLWAVDKHRFGHDNATAVRGIFRRLSNAFKHVLAIGRPRREATSADCIERNVSNRRLVFDLITRPVTS